MDYVFIDTSVFESNNFLAGAAISEMLRFAEEGHITILMPQLIYDEILNRLKENVEDGISKANNSRNSYRILRNIEAFSSRFEEIDQESCYTAIVNTFSERLQKAKVLFLEYPTVNTKNIFAKYFNQQKPFGPGKKKSEFPDAFALETLEQWCVETQRKCIVLANDTDLNSYESDHLITHIGFSDFLNDLQVKVSKKRVRDVVLTKMATSYHTNKEKTEDEISDIIRDQLSDQIKSKYGFHYTDYEIEYDSFRIELEDDYRLIRVSEDKVEIEAFANFGYEVVVTHSAYNNKYNEPFPWQDEMDKDRYEHSQSLIVAIEYIVPLSGIEFAYFEVKGINHGLGVRL